jgi:ABC-type nitrate/sulfonate/bicarbonate transport system substrate-binding protein
MKAGDDGAMKDILTVLALILGLTLSCATGGAQTSRDEKYVIIGTTSKTVGYMAPWVGKIKGFFQAEGVRVDIPILRSATTGFRRWWAVQHSSMRQRWMP